VIDPNSRDRDLKAAEEFFGLACVFSADHPFGRCRHSLQKNQPRRDRRVAKRRTHLRGALGIRDDDEDGGESAADEDSEGDQEYAGVELFEE
jgi:hypothetical protein